MSASNPQLFMNGAEKERLLQEIFKNLQTNTMRLDQDSTLVLLDVDGTLAYLKNMKAKYNDFLMQALQDLAKDPNVKFCLFTKMSLSEIQNKNESEEHAKRTELLLYLKKQYGIDIDRILMPGDLGHKHPQSMQVLEKHIKGFEQNIIENTEKIVRLVLGESKEKNKIEQLECEFSDIRLEILAEKEAKIIELKQKIEELSRDPAAFESSELKQVIKEIKMLMPLEKAELSEAALIATESSELEKITITLSEDKSEFELEEFYFLDLTEEIDAALEAVQRAETELKALKTRKAQLMKQNSIAEFKKEILRINAQMNEFILQGNDWNISKKMAFFEKMKQELAPLYRRLRNYSDGQKFFRELIKSGIEQLLPRYSVMQKKMSRNFVARGFHCTGGSTFVDYYIPAYSNPAMINQYYIEEGVVDYCTQDVSEKIMPRQEIGREPEHSKAPLLDAIFSDFSELRSFPGKIIFFDDNIGCITSVNRRIVQYNAERQKQGVYTIRYVGVHLCNDGIDDEFNRATIITTVGQHLHEKGLLVQVKSDERRLVYEQGRKFISAVSVAGTDKHNKKYNVLLFDKDDTLVTRSQDGLDDGVSINPEIHELIFAYMAMHPEQIAWGMVSAGGGTMGDFVDDKIADDPDLSQFRDKVLHDGFNSKDLLVRDKRMEHFYAGFYRLRPDRMLEEVIEIPANKAQLSKNDFSMVVQYGDITRSEDTGEIILVYKDERRNLQYSVMPGDTITLKTKNGLQIMVDLQTYIAHRDLHRKGDNKVFQALDGMALAKVTVIPNEAMRKMGIVDILAPEDFIFVSPEQVFGLDDKKECVDAWKSAGFNGAVADSRMMFQSRAADAERLKAMAENHKADTEETKRKTEKDKAEIENRKMELKKCRGEIEFMMRSAVDTNQLEHEEKLLNLEKEILKLDEEILKLRKKILCQREVILDKNKDIAVHTEKAQYYHALAQEETDTYIQSILYHLGMKDITELKQRIRSKLVDTTGKELLDFLEKKLRELDFQHFLKQPLNSLIADLKIYMARVADTTIGGFSQTVESFILLREGFLLLMAKPDVTEWWCELKKWMIQFDERLRMCQDEADEEFWDVTMLDQEFVNSGFQSGLFASIVLSTPEDRAKDYVHPVTDLPQQLKIIHETVYTNVKDGTLQTRDKSVTRDVVSTSGEMLYAKKVTPAADQILNVLQGLLDRNFDHTKPEQRAELINQLKNLWYEANKGLKNGGTFEMFSDKTPARKALYNKVCKETKNILNALDILYPDAGAKISQNPQAMSSSSSSRFSRHSSKG